tara:strand:+ start:360 stop:1022 length:663 start_codon:yes stop_codon:yes gene_type:complete
MSKNSAIASLLFFFSLTLAGCGAELDNREKKERYMLNESGISLTESTIPSDSKGDNNFFVSQDTSTSGQADKDGNEVIENQNATAFESGEVLEVISGTEIKVQTNNGVLLVTYAGILIPDNRGPIRKTAKDFNEFLLLGKTVEIEYDQNKFEDIRSLRGFVFSSGVLVNLRLIENGLAVIDDTVEFSRKQRFEDAQKDAINLRLGIWDKDLGSICGTLPC